MDLEVVVLRGRIGGDISSYPGSENKRTFVRFRLAVPRMRKTNSGTYQDLGSKWYTVKAWGTLADNITTSLSKGNPVIVVGYVDSNAWMGKDGEIKSELVVSCISLGHDLRYGISSFQRFSSPSTKFSIEEKYKTEYKIDSSLENNDFNDDFESEFELARLGSRVPNPDNLAA